MTRQTRITSKKMWKKACKTIGEKLEIEGKPAKVIWVYLKNFLSKQKMKLREVDISGAEQDTVEKARRAYKEPDLLSWLLQFVKFSATKTYLMQLEKSKTQKLPYCPVLTPNENQVCYHSDRRNETNLRRQECSILSPNRKQA